MHYDNVIPFDGRNAKFQNFRRSLMPMPFTATIPMMNPLEIEPFPAFRYEGQARDSEVLFEQLEYLIQFADRERDRFNRVRAILLETFN